MKTRRTFLKLLFGAFAVILPWTVFPDKIVEKMNNIIGEPQAILEFPPPSEVKSGIEIKALSRKAIEDIEVLTSENFEGRRACTAGDIKTENYLVEKLIEIGLKGFGKSGFVQIFSIPPMEERIINGRALFRAAKTGLSMPSSNVLGGIEGENKSEIIIISAHFDHLGIYKGNLCPGANDNASGVGCVLEVLRRLVKDELEDEKLKCTVVGVFWGAEEMGYLGSKHFVKDPVIPLENIKAVINLDTVANGNK
ncbi:MAG: M28 family peptidase, partial [Eubacteriales bacterium]